MTGGIPGACRATACALTLTLASTASGQPLLGFPIEGQNPYTAPITTVVDHSATDFYSPDHPGVLAYSGELAAGRPGARAPYGYFHAELGRGKAIRFSVNGHYVGTGADGSLVLNYSGHAGYDYRYGPGTPIVAPADGTLYIPASDALYGRNGDPWCSLHAFYIDHGDGWSTWYLHVDHLALNQGRLADGGLPHACIAGTGTRSEHDELVGFVRKGTEVATVGNFAHGFKGGVGYHLHFEVRRDCIISPADGPKIHGCHVVDPYGWEWPGPDPLAMDHDGRPHNPFAAAQISPLWDLRALGTELPEISGLGFAAIPQGYSITVSGKHFEKGAVVELWDGQGRDLVDTIYPSSETDSRIIASVLRDLSADKGKVVVKIRNPGGPRSRGAGW